jgi:uncharacterized protein YjbI with pentapeptide repeats
MSGSPFQHNSCFLQVTFRSDLLLHLLDLGGVAAWNSWLGSVSKHELIGSVWLEGEQQPVVAFEFDFSNVDLTGRHLLGIDLSAANCSGGNFSRTNLQDAKLCMVGSASFEGADLQGAQFAMADISGCDFTGANLDHASFGLASYPHNRPPRGLPKEILETCNVQGPDKEPKIHVRRRYPSVVVAASLIIPIQPKQTS